MRFSAVALFVSSGIASVIPSVDPFNPVERRQVDTNASPTCGSYVTTTVTPDVVTLTSTDFATTTADTITTTDVVTVDSTEEVTETTTITNVETTFTTETVTAATVIETEVIFERKKRGCGYKASSTHVPAYTARPVSHSYSAYPSSEVSSSAAAISSSSSSSSFVIISSDSSSVTSSSSSSIASSSSSSIASSSSSPVASSSSSSAISTSSLASSSESAEPSTSSSSVTSSTSTSSAVICTVTVTAEASTTVTTVTTTASATATAVETVTTTVVTATTITVSTTDVVTTTVDSTESVTATASVTIISPNPTPTFVLKASGGTVDGQYAKLAAPSSSYSAVGFTSDVSSASSYYFDGSGALVPTVNTNWVALSAGGSQTISLILFGSPGFSGGATLSCTLTGATTRGSTGSFTCPGNNGGRSDLYLFQSTSLGNKTPDTSGTVITLQYTII